MLEYKKITYSYKGVDYVFHITQDDGMYLATCEQDNGGINTQALTMSELVEEQIPDTVLTWVEK